MSVPKIQHRPLFSSDKCSGTVSIVGPMAVAGAVGSVENPVFQGLGTSPADSTAQTLGCSDPQIPPKTRMIGFLRHAFFAARSFSSVADLNTQLTRWIAEVAHARPVPSRREQRVADALAEEQPRLLPLPEHPFPCDLLRAVSSGKTPYIRFDGNDYSIPHTLVRRPLTLVAAEHQVRLLAGTTEVARHARSYARGQRIEDDAHLAALVAVKRRAHDLRGRDRLRHACPQAEAFLEALAVCGHSLASETTRLLRLLDQVGGPALDAALAEALAPPLAAAEETPDDHPTG